VKNKEKFMSKEKFIEELTKIAEALEKKENFFRNLKE